MADPVNQLELGKWLDVDPKTIRTWERQGCPVERKSQKRGEPTLYSVAAVSRWREARAALAASGDLAAMDMEEARRRKLAAEAALAELVLDQKRGEVAEVALMDRSVRKMLAVLRTRLMSIGSSVAPDLELAETGVERQSIVDAAVAEALDEISRSPRDFLGSAGSDDEPDRSDPDEGPGGGDEAAA